MLNKVRDVFYNYCTKTGGKTDYGAQQHDKLLLGKVLGPPNEEA